ncbi:MAG: polysaccharide biosynthesis C-terminal domain-containing protein, partial [Clostridia bacterium]|nr:polysaccharide biosynthesis C-terminal domain-containing protein [Clostridia bacterium]
CMVSITNSMLQAISRPNIPVFTMLCGGVVKLVTNYFLVGTPSININGAPIGMTLCYATITILNFMMLFKTTHIRPNFLNMLIKPLVSAAAMGVGAVVCYNVLSGIINPHFATLAAIVIAAFIYFFMLVALRGFIREDMLLMPKGKKLVSIMERFGWIKRERISK